MNNKNLIFAILFGSTIFLSAFGFSRSALACAFGLKCPKTPIPDMRIPVGRSSSNDSCIAVYNPVKKYSWSITNQSSYTVGYSINRRSYRISPGKTQYYTMTIGGGNGCGSGGYKRSNISFDSSTRSGSQTKTYSIAADVYRRFVFQNNGSNSINFYHLNSSRR